MHSARIQSVREIITKDGKVRERIVNNYQNPNSYVKLTTKTKSGIVLDEIKIPFRSYVSNFARILMHAWLNVTNSTSGDSPNKIIKTDENFTSGNIQTMKVDEGALTSPTATDYGIWIGDYEDLYGGGGILPTNYDMAASPRYDDYNMLHKIPSDGSESMDTNCEYRATSVGLESSDTKLVVKRRFQNDDPSTTIYISEIGLVGKSGTDYFLLARDVPVLNNGVAHQILPTLIKEVQYIFEISDLSGWTKNYLKMLSSEFVDGNSLASLQDTNGATAIIDFTSARTQKNMLALATEDDYGIQIGGWIDPGAPMIVPPKTTSSYKLYSKLEHSASLGYGAVEVIDMVQQNGYTSFGCRRDIENLSTDTYHLYEAANVIKCAAPSTKYFMLNAENFATPSILYPGEIFRYKSYYIFPVDVASYSTP